jgi:hypothetical protein
MMGEDPVPLNMEGRPELQFSSHVIVILIDAPISNQSLL